jgi:hypothetical protein
MGGMNCTVSGNFWNETKKIRLHLSAIPSNQFLRNTEKIMVNLDCMQGMIAGYVSSPKGQEAIRSYLASPEGQKTLDNYLATPEGQQIAKQVLLRTIDRLDVSTDARGEIRRALDGQCP